MSEKTSVHAAAINEVCQGAHRGACDLLCWSEGPQHDRRPGVVIRQQLQQLIGEVAKAGQVLCKELEALQSMREAHSGVLNADIATYPTTHALNGQRILVKGTQGRCMHAMLPIQPYKHPLKVQWDPLQGSMVRHVTAHESIE